MKYVFNPLPRSSIADLALGVEQALMAISNQINAPNINHLPTLTREPNPVTDGMLCICDGSSWNPLNDGVSRAVVRINGTWKGVS